MPERNCQQLEKSMGVTSVRRQNKLLRAEHRTLTGYLVLLKTKLRGLSPHANYTDRAAAAGRRS